MAVAEGSYASAPVLLRLGNFRRASLAYLAGTWFWATLGSSFYGGVHSPGAVLHVSLPASAAWLLGYKACIWTAGAQEQEFRFRLATRFGLNTHRCFSAANRFCG